MTTAERDTLALALLERVTPLLRRYARNYRQMLTYDDLRQDASLHILRLIDAGHPVSELPRYAYVRVRSRIIDKIKYLTRRQAVSLDAGLSQDGGYTLGDLLPSPYSIDPLMAVILKETIIANFAIACQGVS